MVLEDGTHREEWRFGFTSSSFTEWIGHEITVTGLDPAYRHVLRAVEITEDGQYSTLSVNTYADEGVALTANMSVLMSTPKAQVRAHHHETGEHLATAHLDAPLHEGQLIGVGNVRHIVQAVRYPYRDPDDPEQSEDYQHVTLRPAGDTPAPVASLGVATGIPGLMM